MFRRPQIHIVILVSMNIISPGEGCSIHCDEELKYEVERLDGYHSEARWERTEGRRGGGAGVTSRKVRFGRELLLDHLDHDHALDNLDHDHALDHLDHEHGMIMIMMVMLSSPPA